MDDEISVVCSECGHEDWEHNDLFIGCRHAMNKTPHYKFCGCQQSPNAILYDAIDTAINALKRIEQWDFDIMGDCVADAQKLAHNTVTTIERGGKHKNNHSD